MDKLDQAKVRYIDIDGVRTRYYEDGAGEPLVLLHGGHFASLYSLDCWSLNLDWLARRFYVFALDKLGQGYTDNPPTDDAYTFEALLNHTASFLNKVGIRGAHLVGHSRGALLVACLALDFPELAKSVVVVDSNTLAPEDPRWPSGQFYAELERRMPPGPPTRETTRMEPDAQSFSRDHVSEDFVSRMNDIASLEKTRFAEGRMKAKAGDIWRASLERARGEALHRIDEHGMRLPTLVIWANNDLSAPLPLGLQLFSRIAGRTPQAEFHILNQAGHYCFREQSAAFNRLVTAFCDCSETA